MSMNPAPHHGGASGTIQYVVLDKLMRPIEGLDYQLLIGSSARATSGVTDAFGLTEAVHGPAGSIARFMVSRLSGGYKEIHQTRFAGTPKIITATSPAILVEASTELHKAALTKDADSQPVVVIDEQDVKLEFLQTFDGTEIEDEDFEAAAIRLNCEVAAIKAVAETESGSTGSFFRFSGWDVVPAILYERHYFHQLTEGAYDKTHPDLSSGNAGGYGKYTSQYRKLIRAYQLDPDAALKSASWGKFQIMGRWHKAAGHGSVEDFVKAISASEKNHLAAFVSFIQADRRLVSAVVAKDWMSFALVYNGPRQRGYDQRMKEAYERLSL